MVAFDLPGPSADLKFGSLVGKGKEKEGKNQKDKDV